MIAKAQNMRQDKVRVLQPSLYRAAKARPKRKFGVLYEKVCRRDVLRAAYQQVKANGGAPGIDRQTFETIEKEIGVDEFLRDIQNACGRSGTGPCRCEGSTSPRPMGSKGR